MASAPSNPSMNWSARNLNEEWHKFEQHAKLMFKGPLRAIDEESEHAHILIWVGETGRDIYNSWTLSKEESKPIQTLYNRFGDHTIPRKNSCLFTYKIPNNVSMAMQGSLLMSEDALTSPACTSCTALRGNVMQKSQQQTSLVIN